MATPIHIASIGVYLAATILEAADQYGDQATPYQSGVHQMRLAHGGVHERLDPAQVTNTPMKRFFFDIASQQSCSYDHHGHRYSNPEDAAQAAELMAMEFGCSETDDHIGSQVQVRNEAGNLLFSIPIVIAA